MAKRTLKNYETVIDCPKCETGKFTYRIEEYWANGFINPLQLFMHRTCGCRLTGEHNSQAFDNVRYNWAYGEEIIEV